MKSRRRHRSKWAHCNTPEAIRRRLAAADARREALAADLPLVYSGPEPLSPWQTVIVLDAAGNVAHRIALFVPTSGRCDQHAAEVDGARCDKMLTATDIGRKVAGWISKRPSVAVLSDWRREV